MPCSIHASAMPSAVDAARISPAPVQRWRADRLGLGLAILWLTGEVLAALSASLLPLASPIEGDLTAVLTPPGPEYWLGADSLGRDILARCIFGARVSLTVALGAVAIGLLLGGALGLLAGYFRGTLDRVITGVMTVLLCFPALMLAIAIVASLGPNLLTVTIAIGVLFVPAFARIARANTLVFREREFVLAAEALGARAGRILLREVVPNVMPSLLSYALVMLGVAILAEASLGFLGLSVRPPLPSWGGMIAAERGNLADAPHAVFAPALVLFATVLATNVLGERVRRLSDVKAQAL